MVIMLFKIEWKEKNSPVENVQMELDFHNHSLTYYKNDILIKQEVYVTPPKEWERFLRYYITYWDVNQPYKTIIDGKETELTLHTTKEDIHYYFKNQYPDNYPEFIKEFKKKVMIYE